MTPAKRGTWKNRETISTVFQMAWPSVLESFFVALVGLVDTFMVSGLGAPAVAAVGLTAQPKFIVLALFLSVNVSLAAVTARRRGQQDRQGANQALLCALYYVFIVGIAASAAAVYYAEDIMLLCGAREETVGGATLYFQIVTGGMMFNIVSLAINAAQRGAGNTKIAMITNVTANLVNVAGNYLLIEGRLGFPAWGIKGAAAATVAGTVLACIMSIMSVMRPDCFISIPYIWKERIRPGIDTFKRLLGLGSNIFAEQLLMRIGFMATAVMAARLGTETIAAHQVGMNVIGLSFSLGDGMQAAAVALIGRSLGEQNPDLAQKYGNTCLRLGIVIATSLSGFYLFGGEWLYSKFFREKEIIAMGVTIIRLIAVIIFLQISQTIYMGCLRGAGDVRFTMAASTFSALVVRTAVSYLLCFVLNLGIRGIWLGIMGDQLSRCLLGGYRFRSGKWTGITI